MTAETTPVARYTPEVRDRMILGGRCAACGYATAPPTARCPRCGGTVASAAFAPRGTVWGSTVVHVAVGHREPPFGLAYVDLEDGPRILARTAAEHPLAVGAAVVVSVDGDDLVAEPA